MANEDLMSTLYKNRRNLTIEVLDYVCMTLVCIKSIEVKESFRLLILKFLKY